MSVGWGMVGIGRHPDRWVAPAIQRSGGSRLVAVVSRSRERAQAFASRHGAEMGCTSMDEMLSHPGVDAVYVASPNALHPEHTIAAARAGKHVLCEKPMALTPDECRSMIEECRRNGVRLGVGFHLRHHPALRKARQLATGGALGRIVDIQAQWAKGERGQATVPPRTGLEAWWMQPELVGAGAMMATGVHAVDAVRFLTGEEVVEVTGLADARDESQPLEWLIHLVMRLTSGCLASVLSSRLIPDSRNDLVAYGSRGRLVATQVFWERLAGGLEVTSDTVNSSERFEKGDPYLNEIVAFTEAVEQGRDPDASGTDGLRVCEITVAALDSARRGTTVGVGERSARG